MKTLLNQQRPGIISSFVKLLSLLVILCGQNSFAAPLIKPITIKPVIDKTRLVKKNINPFTGNKKNCPDLTLLNMRIIKVDYYNQDYYIYISGVVKNIGGVDYIGKRNQQRIRLSASHAVESDIHFLNVLKGKSERVQGLIRGIKGGEFTPDIHLALKYSSPYFRRGKDKISIDCNLNNNSAVIARSKINQAITQYHRTHPRKQHPDLILQNPSPRIGVITIKNQGGTDAAANKLLMTCKKQGFRGHKGFGCPKIIEKLPYSQTAHGYVFNVPAIRAGQSYQLRIPGSFEGKWKNGHYNFTYLVDANRTVQESNERNNSANKNLIVSGM